MKVIVRNKKTKETFEINSVDARERCKHDIWEMADANPDEVVEEAPALTTTGKKITRRKRVKK